MKHIILVPGLYNSGSQHWQSCWHRHYADWQRVEQKEWDHPDLERWVEPILALLSQSSEPQTLVAHSFGCLASLYAAQLMPEKIRSLFLVAPADPDILHVNTALVAQKAAAPGRIFASTNDPYMSVERLKYFNESWQLPLYILGQWGHINAESGLGEWPEGVQLLESHLRQYAETSR